MRINGLIWVASSYFLALSVGYFSTTFFLDRSILFQVFIADIAATFIIYFFSVWKNNSSFYDPYWSIIPPFLAFFWIQKNNISLSIESILLISAILFWSIRLTANWIKTWEGLHHEDWRYIDMRNKMGRWFQILGNLGGIHFFPTLIVFFCCMPFMYIGSSKPNMLVLFLGIFISIVGVILEIISDFQLHQFRQKNSGKKGIIESGLWKYSRHPNYYGEILFWWGMYVFGFSYQGFNYLIFAPISMTLMFIFVSIPWIENKILRTRPEYKDYQKRVHILFPEITIFKRLIGR
jgi:steroid 5-alpha reductase family enzyme